MNRIRGGATALGVAALATVILLATGGDAWAQATTGRVTGRVTDKETGAALPGVTVMAQGPAGEDATITDSKGDYLFTNLPIGNYAIRFFIANNSAEVQGVTVSAEKTVRVNAKIAAAAQAAAQQTYVITGKPPSVDVGSTRVGTVFDETYFRNIPNGLTYGDLIQRAPGSFVDPSGNVSIGGATGLENIYTVNGLNVTGTEYGNLESGAASLSGGSNLPLEFLSQLDVSAGGYQAEFGGAMGGVISTVLKSGTNQLHGSVFTSWAPYQLSASPKFVVPVGSSIGGVRKPDFDTNIGVEVGGPIIKDKLYFWVGLAPRFTNSHVFRLTYAQQEDPANPGQPLLDANGNPVVHELTDWRARINETHQTYNYAATLDWAPNADNRLTLGIFGTPSYNVDLHNVFNGGDISANPSQARESLTKTNSDVTLHWVSKLLEKRWILEASAGLHREDFNDRSPDDALNKVNQLEYWGSNLWDLEHAPGCQPITSTFTNPSGQQETRTFQPCPVNPNYRSGGFGIIKNYTAQRWLGEVKSTHLIEAGGHHELKYGWRLEYTDFDQDRWYSGPPGGRALIQLAPNGGNPVGIPDPYYNTWTLFTLPQGQYPVDFGQGGMHPTSDLIHSPYYQDDLKANVTSLSNAFFLQEGYSPAGLRNLNINVGARLELQRMTDSHGVAFLDTQNLGPRIGAVYDPLNDGRSKISASYGRYFEAIPMNLAARYFGGEGILLRNGLPYAGCNKTNPYAWTGAAEYKDCPIPAVGDTMDNAAGGSSFYNNGTNYPVQSHLQGQFHNEIVATVERELMEDLTVRLDYIHRWLGTIIEDGATDPNSFTFVLANPGNVPQAALDDAQKEVDTLAATDQNDPRNASALANAQAKLATLQGLAKAPKPERTYDALSLSLNKRFSKNWFLRGSYTYSRLIGNYEGLYQAEQNYFAPNGNNTYDTQDLYNNAKGPLPNDRPHQGRIDGFYTVAMGRGQLTLGLSFSGRSGMPRNYISQLIGGNQLVMLLPRGAAGRTPPVTQFDGRIAYARPLSATVNLEAFISLFNLLNQQATLLVDDNYTYDMAAPIVNGTAEDLKFAKNVNGAPVSKNPNYGRALAYQPPFSARLGLRLTF